MHHTARRPWVLTAAAGVIVLCCALLSTQRASAQEPTLEKNYFSVGTGLPVPVGGLLRLEVLHRFDDRNFAKLGMGTSAIISGVYLSYGRRFSADPDSAWYAYGGLENNIIAAMGDAVFLPGVHAGIGKEWLTSGGWRLALGAAVGLPWLGGITLEIGQ